MSTELRHKLLIRQLRRHFGSVADVPASLLPFLEAVEAAYSDADDDRAMMDHSLETVSRELADRLDRVRAAIGERDEVQQAMSLLEATLEASSDAVLVLDLEGNEVRSNQQLQRLWRLTTTPGHPREAVPAPQRIAAQLESGPRFRDWMHRRHDERPLREVEEVRTNDGRVIEWHSSPQYLDDTIVGWVWSFRDMTARLQLEDQLRQSQKMEAIGKLAGGVAHDFNNLLSVIEGNAELLASEPDIPPAALDLLWEITSATERASQLTSQLLAFSRKQTLRATVFDLSRTVNALIPMLRRMLGSGTALEVDATTSFVTADRTQLDQVLLNLVVNARDATTMGGSISIRCGDVQLGAPRDAVQGDRVPPGHYAMLAVHDTGAGIPVELQERVFEPFFTTKATGEGTGLGLSMVYGLVRQSGGFVLLDSAPGRGTTIEILLPAHSPSTTPTLPSTTEATATASVVPSGNTVHPISAAPRTVLVVDDEEAVRRVVATVLRRHGFTTIEAASARDALTTLAERPEVHLVISDVLMPELGGRELARQLRRDYPDMPILFISGYTNEELSNEGGSLEGTATFLAKPFSSQRLLQAVHALLR